MFSSDVGVSPTRRRRRFTSAYKQQMVEAAAQCMQRGELGALLRREGLYASQLQVWRTAARHGDLTAREVHRGPKPITPHPHTKRVAELERQLRRETTRADRLALIVEVQKKVAQLLDLAPPPSEPL